MMTIVAISGSPRRGGNTDLLLERAVEGARAEGGLVETFALRDLKISPCLEIYGCKKNGRCVIKDDFQTISEHLQTCRGVILASPIFFYTLSSHTKMLMDRCQSLWVKKYWIEQEVPGRRPPQRKGLFISAGATRGKKLFDGACLSVRYFFDTFDAELWKSLLYRGLDLKGDVLSHPEYLEEAFQSGQNLVRAIGEDKP